MGSRVKYSNSWFSFNDCMSRQSVISAKDNVRWWRASPQAWFNVFLMPLGFLHFASNNEELAPLWLP